VQPAQPAQRRAEVQTDGGPFLFVPPLTGFEIALRAPRPCFPPALEGCCCRERKRQIALGLVGTCWHEECEGACPADAAHAAHAAAGPLARLCFEIALDASRAPPAAIGPWPFHPLPKCPCESSASAGQPTDQETAGSRVNHARPAKALVSPWYRPGWHAPLPRQKPAERKNHRPAANRRPRPTCASDAYAQALAARRAFFGRHDVRTPALIRPGRPAASIRPRLVRLPSAWPPL